MISGQIPISCRNRWISWRPIRNITRDLVYNVVDENSRPVPGVEGYCVPGPFTMADYVVEGELPGQTATLVYRNIYLHPAHDYSIEARAHDFRSDVTVTLILLSLGNIYTLPIP